MFKDCLGNEVSVGTKIVYPTKLYNGKIAMRQASIRYFKIDASGLKVGVYVRKNGFGYKTMITKAFSNCVRVV